MQVSHFRDYAQTLTEGGSKGEKCDYLLVDLGDGSLRYVPVMSKLKLNKKRKAHAFAEDEEAAHSQVQRIVIAERGFTSDDARQIQANLSLCNNKALKVGTVPFESKQQLLDVERSVATELKSMFKSALKDEPMESEDDIFKSSADEAREPEVKQEVKQENAKERAPEVSEDDIF